MAVSVNIFAQSAEDIVNKHFEALGGKDKFKELKTLKMNGKFTMMGMDIPFNIALVNGKCYKFNMTFQGMDMVQCVTGDSGWFISPFEGKKDPEKMPADMIKESKSRMDLGGPLFNYKEKGNKVELVGKEDMEGTEIYKIRVTEKEGDVTYYYIDATSYLLLKETSKHKFKDKEVEGEELYSNYKKVDGMMFPFSMESRAVGESEGQVMTYETIEVNPKIDETIFKMPKAGSTSTGSGK